MKFLRYFFGILFFGISICIVDYVMLQTKIKQLLGSQ